MMRFVISFDIIQYTLPIAIKNSWYPVKFPLTGKWEMLPSFLKQEKERTGVLQAGQSYIGAQQSHEGNLPGSYAEAHGKQR